MTASKKTILAAVGIAVLGAGLGVAGLAAADPTPTTTPSVSPTAGPAEHPGPRGGGPGRGGDFGPRGDALSRELANKLGLDQTKVSQALRTARQAARPPRPTAKPTPGQTPPDPAERDATLAKALARALGIDEATIATALDEIRADRQAERAAALKTRLDAAVRAGKLTQTEADAVRKAVDRGVIDVGPR